MSVHVAVDAHDLADDRGIGRYLRAVLCRVMREPGVRWTLVDRRLFPDRNAIARAVGGAPFALARSVPRDADVVWSPCNGTFLTGRAPSVATIHDCTPFAYPARDARRRRAEQAPFVRTAAEASHILADSAFGASDVTRWLGIPPERITVIALGVDDVFIPGAPRTLPAPLQATPYVLCVGSHDVRKNTTTLGAAFERAFAPGTMTLAFTRAPVTLGRDAVVVDAPDDAALADLYRGATIVAVPSTMEGFGLPLLEALACGAPALASRTSALPEVGGDAAVWIDDPLDIAAWAAALARLARDARERARLARAGPRRARLFSWDRCAAETLAALITAARR